MMGEVRGCLGIALMRLSGHCPSTCLPFIGMRGFGGTSGGRFQGGDGRVGSLRHAALGISVCMGGYPCDTVCVCGGGGGEGIREAGARGGGGS